MDKSENNTWISWIIQTIIFDAIEKDSSDIHLEPQKNNLMIRYRLDWDLYIAQEISNEIKDNIITKIKLMAHMKIDETRLPQDWNFVINFWWVDIDIRVSTFPILYWEKIVLRLLKKNENILNINSLWFLKFNLQHILNTLSMKEWLILISWPTWSWKTTTLYSMINHFDPKKYNILTLEDPIEYKLDHVNQSQINKDIWYTFSVGLRSILRLDPNIILIWEIRDEETAKLAIEASLTWHLVFWTIHSNWVYWVIERLMNMWIEKYLISSSLKLIIYQNLIKKICDCWELTFPNEQEINIFSNWLWELWESCKPKIKFIKSKWCQKCLNSWFKWRIWIHELVYVDNEIKKFLNKSNIDKSSWNLLIKEKWFLNIYQDWLLKVLFWFTDLSQILSYNFK